MKEPNFIKVNLPPTMEDYERGSGEGCFFIVDDRTKAAHDLDATGGEFFGILDNNSLYYKGLEHGERLPIEMRGKQRPIVPIEALSKWEVRTPEEIKRLYEKHLARELAEEDFPGEVFKTRISQAVALAEAPAAGRDIFQYKPGSKPAKQYEEVVNDIIARTKA